MSIFSKLRRQKPPPPLPFDLLPSFSVVLLDTDGEVTDTALLSAQQVEAGLYFYARRYFRNEACEEMDNSKRELSKAEESYMRHWADFWKKQVRQKLQILILRKSGDPIDFYGVETAIVGSNMLTTSSLEMLQVGWHSIRGSIVLLGDGHSRVLAGPEEYAFMVLSEFERQDLCAVLGSGQSLFVRAEHLVKVVGQVVGEWNRLNPQRRMIINELPMEALRWTMKEMGLQVRSVSYV